MKAEGLEFNQAQPAPANPSEHLEYLHLTEKEKLKAKLTIQRMVMARLFGFEDIGDDPDPERTRRIQEEWIDEGLSEKFAKILNESPELLLKYTHSGEYANAPVDSGDVIDEVFAKLMEGREVHA